MKPVIYIRSGLLTAAILFAAGCGGGGSKSTPSTPQAQTPTITAVANQMVAQDSMSTPIMFTVSDDSDPSTLKVTATAANSDLIAQDGLTITGNGGSRALTIMPNDSAFGTTTVSLVVTDATGAQATVSFNVQVTTMATSFLSFANQTVATDESSQPRALAGLSFTQDADDPASFNAALSN
jgi:hypothetical protein